MRVLLLGKKGMLGSCFLKQLAASPDFEMFAFDRSELDITDFSSIEKLFKDLSPDFVINCAAFTQVDAAEENTESRELNFKVNTEAVEIIAKACKSSDSILLHFSTDYVFDGKNIAGYNEDSKPNPINNYGKSKLAGEEAIISNCEKYYIVRSSWLFGENGRNFVDTMLKLAEEKTELKVVNDQFGSPTYTHDLASAVRKYFLNPYCAHLDRHHSLSLEESLQEEAEQLPFGIYHLTNSESCSWFEFAKKIFEVAGKKVNVLPVNTEEFPRPAKRPKNSILNNTKLPKLRSWGEALEAYLSLKIGHR